MTNERRKQAGPQLLLRFPAGSDLRDRLNKVAEENNRSLTAEIINRLELSLQPAKNTGHVPNKATLAARLEALKEEFDARLSEIECEMEALR